MNGSDDAATASAIPAWLEQPPTELPPPISMAAPSRLPFEALTPSNFERLVLAMARRTFAVDHAQQYGVSGQKQHGIDLYLRLAVPPVPTRRYVTIQCRNIVAVTPAGVAAAVEEFLSGRWADLTTTFIYATRASTRRTDIADAVESAAERLNEFDVRYEVWDGDQLSERLRTVPDLVEVYFGRATKDLFCQRSTAAFGVGAAVNATHPDDQALPDLAVHVSDAMRHARRAERDRGYRDALGVASSLPWAVFEQLAKQDFELTKWLQSWKNGWIDIELGRAPRGASVAEWLPLLAGCLGDLVDPIGYEQWSFTVGAEYLAGFTAALRDSWTAAQSDL
ncbi:hypothetical protein ACFCV3_22135 [Kribbella sp. NPDC056345]|uniref:hypothetical protein n=1 Tax=Kribbella sp. NPDC056345 TaxID=3345789 RepID=UPI0035D58966